MTELAPVVTDLNDERLIREGEAAVGRFLKSNEAILPMARGLLAARRRFPAHQAFGEWVRSSAYSQICDDDRAALINIGKHEGFAASYMRTTNLVSPQLVWKAMKELLSFSYDTITTSPALNPPVPQGTPPETPQESRTTLPAKTESTRSKSEPAKREALPREQARTSAGRPSAFSRLPEADLLRGHFLSKKSKYTLSTVASARGAGRVINDLVLESIKRGFFGPPTPSDIRTPSLRLVLPWLTGEDARPYDMSKKQTQDMVRDVLFPLLQDTPDLLKPENRHRVIPELERRRRALEEEARRQSLLSGHRTKVDSYVFPVGEQEIVAYGAPLWPALSTPRYSFRELTHACWFAQYFLSALAKREWRPLETAMAANHLIKYLAPVAPGFATAVKDIFAAYQVDPNGVTKMPPVPPNQFTA